MARPSPPPRSQSGSEPEIELHAEATPGPELVYRAAKPSDAAALAALFGQLDGVDITASDVSANLALASKRNSGLAVAELGVIVGCCGWAVVSTVHRGPLGRLTVLIVDEDHRRRGIATSLLALTETELKNSGCSQVEAMSDIAIKNAHNFFRSLKFEQTSYRFVRTID